MVKPEAQPEAQLVTEVLAELRALDADGTVLADLIATFQADVEQKLAALKAALDAEQHLEVGRIAHSLAGSARTLGATRLAVAAKELQIVSRTADVAEEQRLLGELADAVPPALRALHRYLGG